MTVNYFTPSAELILQEQFTDAHQIEVMLHAGIVGKMENT